MSDFDTRRDDALAATHAMPPECSDALPDYSKMCDCEQGDGPNCDRCVETLAEELAACIDSAQETRQLAEQCLREMYGFPRNHDAEVRAARALKEQLHRLWRRVVGVRVEL